jgi:hypothetical protein
VGRLLRFGTSRLEWPLAGSRLVTRGVERFATRLKGVYLADMLGGHGEQPPGLGEIDFQKLAPELGRSTVRVLVVDDDKGSKLRFGSEYLAKVGIF